MARPLSYDRETVLDQAMQLFWRKGYERTSIRDLVDSTGLNPGSLYDGFGDKRAMFLAAMECYCDTVVAEMVDCLATTRPGGAAIRGFFSTIVESAAGDRWCLGCLLVNTSVDSSQIDADISDAVRDHLHLIERALGEAVERGQRDGSIAMTRPAPVIAAYLMTVLTGLRVSARAGSSDGQRIAEIVDVALAPVV